MKPAAGQQEGSPDREVLAVSVERVTLHNPENGFCVLRTQARGHRDLVTVVGHSAMVAPGERITASGEWVNDRTHGQQFRARFVRTAKPPSVEGIEKYLGSVKVGTGPRRNWLRAAPAPSICAEAARTTARCTILIFEASLTPAVASSAARWTTTPVKA